ncbi:GL27055 [Drosophila persimilis]|uniref:Heat shock protein beta-6 isoform X1 n=4 Tax=Sophophora TaxID=32341 RepID=Q29IV3_DROPS|nr:heat shock protein beta-6 isoform X1 [Drosophila pseudoobscura]XP_001963454.1 heat shock protein beta-6 isoform X1 [Drosophila ananassae]XP_002027929.1 heat shock protein beta-6 isoform X1 [Drosophila persimilis]XP_017034769.1 heat shock protein beta-6 isoform X1 [Drosophila kikkawai]XP_017109814.1 heat shock protein beta-6 isoform X1 [Drosophila bipectinata]XP_017137642.1 heat shock protein beta-6 isoform X1 [Drosophila miranda]XP_020803399.1 heat shock protein beta-6 isoform X1 [Drosophi
MAEANKRNIPIKLGDFSVIDTEFSNIRERFDSEMRKMEEEMAKFRHELMNREANFFESTSSTKKTTTTTSSTTNSALPSRIPKQQNYVSDISSPLIQDEGDNKVLKLRFDVSQYAPEEIVVKTVDQKLLVHAKHEEKSDTKSVYREYNREFLLPKGVNPESIRSSLSKDGVLTVDAPLPALTAGETLIPIAHK